MLDPDSIRMASAKKAKVSHDQAQADAPKWIVIGFHGFIGRAAVQTLRDCNYNVYGLAHTELPQLAQAVAAGPIAGVVNCAGLVRGSKEDVWNGQVGFVTNLVSILNQAAQPPRLVHISTERVHGWRGKAELGDNEVWCLEVERVLAAQYAAPLLSVLRLVNVFGPGARPNYNSAIATWVDRGLGKLPLELNGRGHCRHFVHITEVQAVIKSVCQSPSSEQQPLICDVGDRTRDVDIADVATIIATAAGGEVVMKEGAGGGSCPELLGTQCLPSQDAAACGLIPSWAAYEQGLQPLVEQERVCREICAAHDGQVVPAADEPDGVILTVSPGQQLSLEHPCTIAVGAGEAICTVVREGSPRVDLQLQSGEWELLSTLAGFSYTVWNPSLIGNLSMKSL